MEKKTKKWIHEMSSERLNAESTRIISSPEVTDKFVKQGVEPRPGTPEQFGELVRTEVSRWAKVIKDAGIKSE